MNETKITVFIYLPGKTRAVPAGILHMIINSVLGLNYGRKYPSHIKNNPNKLTL
jgi:hypothetical protein